MEDIFTAKRDLYNSLRMSIKEVIGAGIKQKNGTDYIVIFLSKNTSDANSRINKEYKGYKVVTEVKSFFRALFS